MQRKRISLRCINSAKAMQARLMSEQSIPCRIPPIRRRRPSH